jgi:glycosyltransferase involved in cell wall biosynthesis
VAQSHKLQIGFDATSLTREGKGLARFQAEFLRGCAGLSGSEPQSLTVFVPDDVDRDACPPGFRYVHVRARPMLRWEQLHRPRLARKLGLDVLLHLSERASFFGPPQVVYLYEHPKHRARINREVGAPLRQRTIDALTVALFRLAVRRVEQVLCASKATRSDVGRGEVVYPGVSELFTPGERERTYFLHIASSDPRDNSGVAIEAYRRLPEPRPKLVIGGNAPASLRKRTTDLDVEWAGFRTGEALAHLYRGALAYVDPSLFEGFGLQAAEALACGTPVICSNVSSLPEVVDGAGFLLDPNDVAGFSGAMRRLADEPALRAELVARARLFSWEQTARETLAACERAAHGRADSASAS